MRFTFMFLFTAKFRGTSPPAQWCHAHVNAHACEKSVYYMYVFKKRSSER